MSTQLQTAPPPSAAAAPAAAAEWVRVSKTYSHPLFRGRKVEALREVSLRIEPGEAFGLIGPNRAGKTTLLKVLLSLCRPTSGQASRLGAPVADRSTLARVGYVHENHAFPNYLTASGLLEYYGALTLLSPEAVRERVPKLLKRFGLADRGREPIARFSKGMIQRLGLAQALLNEPQLLVLDEPTEGLDLDGRKLLREAVTEVRGARRQRFAGVARPGRGRIAMRSGRRHDGRPAGPRGADERVPAPPDAGQDPLAGAGVAAIHDGG